MIQSPVELKGSNFTLSVVYLYHEDPEIIAQGLLEKIRQAPALLQGAPIVLNIQNLPADSNWLHIKQAIQSTGLHIVGVSGWQNDIQRRALMRVGFSTLNEGKIVTAPQKIISSEEPAVITSKIINKPVRSGQQIYARNGDLIVTCGVSAGAELVADGHIHIYGIMRGRALAGAKGNKNSEIFCTNLQAELVSIAGEYWLSEQIPNEFHGLACRLRLQDNALTIKLLN